MAEAYIDVAPELLAQAVSMLPSSVKIVGSMEQDGSVRLKLNVRDMPGGHLKVHVTDSVSRRIVDLMVARDG